MRYSILIFSFFLISKIGFSQNDNYKQMRLFNKLWTKIDENYPSFKLKGIDWHEMYNYIKPKVSPTLTQEQLMDTLSLMLRPLNDGHVGVSMIKFFPLRVPKDFIAERKSQFYSEFKNDSLVNRLFYASNLTLQRHNFKSLNNGYNCDKSIIDFTESDKYGYIHISHMEGISKREVRDKMKTIISELTKLEGLIIDVRDNKGGLDQISDLITSYFIDSLIVARFEQTRINKTYDSFSMPKTIEIKPSKKLRFTKNIVILTNDRTRSAGEYIVLSLKDLSYVKVVGDRTEGMLGGSKIGFLPYGWIYGFNKWKVTSRYGVWYEDVGIPPDYLIQNKIGNLENLTDPLIEKAIELFEN